MKTKSLRNYSTINLIGGYLCSFLFILLILFNRPIDKEIEIVEVTEDELFNAVTPEKPEVVYVPTVAQPTVIERDLRGYDGAPVIFETDRDVVIPARTTISRVDDFSEVVLEENLGRHIYQDKLIGGKIYNEKNIHGDNTSVSVVRGDRHGIHSVGDGVSAVTRSIDDGVDLGLLDRRLRDLDHTNARVEVDAYDEAVTKDNLKRDEIGLSQEDKGLNLSEFTVAREGDDAELGDIDPDFNKNGKGYGVGKGGELYAYNFPTQGVGAGIGSSAIGAGAGGGAGLSAAIGEGILNGEAVPTLGGVGDGAKSLDGEPAEAAGVGGLLGGAGAGGAAGLTQGYVTPKLGLGIGNGVVGAGGHGNDRGYDYDDLPKDGALHIMMHVDGSGSILNTRKQLEVMKDSILKEALLPYYNNDPDLYNRRVTIVDNSGERTLRFFTEAAQKDNVLAIAFQDEAQPAYHLPNFNRKPEDHYLTDLKALKGKLGTHKGIYRGVLFQVDRGRTFARSFKEFVGNAFHGTGYLASHNLKNYHRDNNSQHIKNKNGVVFSDEYHAKDEGTPEYYLDLLFNASRKVGLDLNVHKGGLTDGKYIKNNP